MSQLSSAVRRMHRWSKSLRAGKAEAAPVPAPVEDGGPQRAHFVRDYRRYVGKLIEDYPLDEAMSYAVGGNYEKVGNILAERMIELGLRDGMNLLDLGCGSGRLAQAVAKRVKIDYLGLDVVPELVDYARSKCPPHYQFVVNEELSLPAPSVAFDMVAVFSVFTHLLHEESYLYLLEIERVLKPGGVAVVSFLEFEAPGHWSLFEMTIAQARLNRRPHLNVFVERNALAVWARRAGLAIREFSPLDPLESDGQTIVVFVKPAAPA